MGRLGTAVAAGLLLYFACVLALRIIRAEDFAELRNYFRRRRAVRISGGPGEGGNDSL
jgi:hypothetical protein